MKIAMQARATLFGAEQDLRLKWTEDPFFHGVTDALNLCMCHELWCTELCTELIWWRLTYDSISKIQLLLSPYFVAEYKSLCFTHGCKCCWEFTCCIQIAWNKSLVVALFFVKKTSQETLQAHISLLISHCLVCTAKIKDFLIWKKLVVMSEMKSFNILQSVSCLKIGIFELCFNLGLWARNKLQLVNMLKPDITHSWGFWLLEGRGWGGTISHQWYNVTSCWIAESDVMLPACGSCDALAFEQNHRVLMESSSIISALHQQYDITSGYLLEVMLHYWHNAPLLNTFCPLTLSWEWKMKQGDLLLKTWSPYMKFCVLSNQKVFNFGFKHGWMTLEGVVESKDFLTFLSSSDWSLSMIFEYSPNLDLNKKSSLYTIHFFFFFWTRTSWNSPR